MVVAARTFEMKKKCVACGHLFESLRGAASCSSACKNKRRAAMASKRREQNPQKFRDACNRSKAKKREENRKLTKCVVCGESLRGHHVNARTCSDACKRMRDKEVRRKWYTEHQQEVLNDAKIYAAKNKERRRKRDRVWRHKKRGFVDGLRECLVCGTRFAINGPQKTCSSECRRRHNNATTAKWKLIKFGVRFDRCIICGKTFKRANNKLTCGQACAENIQRRAVRDWYVRQQLRTRQLQQQLDLLSIKGFLQQCLPPSQIKPDQPPK